MSGIIGQAKAIKAYHQEASVGPADEEAKSYRQECSQRFDDYDMLWEDVVRAFAQVEAETISTSSACAQLRTLCGQGPPAFLASLEWCLGAALSFDEKKLCARRAERFIDLICEASEGQMSAEGVPISLCLLRSLVQKLGKEDAAPRDREVRLRGARLLSRLLPSAMSCDGVEVSASVRRAAVLLLLRLSRDKLPAVRLAAVPGLALLEQAETRAGLLRMVGDPAAGVRAEAVAVVASRADLADPAVAAALCSRSLDVSAVVRRRLYEALVPQGAMTEDADAFWFVVLGQAAVVQLLRRGLLDASSPVRKSLERALCAWLARQGSCADILLEFLATIDVEANEDVAEAFVRCISSSLALLAVVGSFSSHRYSVETEFPREKVFLWRMASVFDDTDGSNRTLRIQPLVMQATNALKEKRCFEVRQHLQVLVSLLEQRYEPPEDDDNREVLCFAAAVLQSAPLDVLAKPPTAIGLALSLVKQVSGTCHVLGKTFEGSREGQFLHIASNALRALQGMAIEPFHIIFDGLCFEDSACRKVLWPDSAEPVGPGLGDVAPQFQSALDEVRQSGDEESLEVLQSIDVDLVSLTFRALRIAEGALSMVLYVDEDESGVLKNLIDVWIHPTLMRADAAEAVLGTAQWAPLRALAIRCLALHTSMHSCSAAMHWPFFAAVLERYGQGLAAMPSHSVEASAAALVVESCILFLADVTVTHRCEAEAAERTRGLFAALAPALGLPSSSRTKTIANAEAGHVHPQQRRRKIAQCLCTLLIYGDAASVFHDAAHTQVAEGASVLSAGMQWSLTWLLLETFFQYIPSEIPSDEDAEEAAHRGRLLRFFGSLAHISFSHVSLLAASCEGLLSTDLWQLGLRSPMFGGGRWSPVQLPRLLRLVSRQLVLACSAGRVDLLLSLWTTSVWRPLALLCSEVGRSDLRRQRTLAEALVAALASIEGEGAAAPFAAAEAWPAIVAEVAEAMAAILLRWRCFKRGSSAEHVEAFSAEEKAPPVQPMLQIAARFAAAAALEERAPGTWLEAQAKAEVRRGELRSLLETFAPDVRSILAIGAEAAISAGTQFQAKAGRARRLSATSAGPARKKIRRISRSHAASVKRQRPASDDDSDP